MNKVMTILMVDDDPDDYCLVKDAILQKGLRNDFRFLSDGEELMDYLSRRGKYVDPKSSPLPCLILLDLNMPGKGGRETLKTIKADPALRQIPVVMFTDSTDTNDIVECYRLGANSFITKPKTFDSLLETITALETYWLKVTRLPIPSHES